MSDFHHANLLVGSLGNAESYLAAKLRSLGIETLNNPDFIVFREAVFGIDEARKLAELSSRRAFFDKKVFFIAPERITAEAQNALLKTFEDPSSETFFFLVAKEEALIIPTLRSRMLATPLNVEHSVFNKEAEQFLQLPPKDRLLFSKKFVDDEKNLSNFLDELMLVLKNKSEAENLERVYRLRKFADDRSASSRLILEHLALVLS